MKHMTCAQMGGPCETMIAGETAEAMIKNGMDHVTEAHTDLAEQIKSMTPEQGEAWGKEFQAKFDALAEA